MSRGVEVEVELGAGPDEVWDVVADPHRLGEWVTTHAGLGDEVPHSLDTGSSFEQELSLAGVRFTVTWTVVACERPVRLDWDGKGPKGSSAKVSYRLEEVEPGRTRFAYSNRFELPGGPLGRLAGRTVGDSVARREAERTLENLRRLVAGADG